MNCIKNLLIIFIACYCFFNTHIIHSQNRQNGILKIGGFVFTHDSKYSGYSINFEYEKLISKNEYLTFGPRIDYIYLKEFISRNLYLAYQLKLYPFYRLYHKPFRGFFIGVYPFYLVKDPRNGLNRYGPGLGSSFGFQIVNKNRLSLSLEMNMNYFQNLNSNVPKKNNLDRYFGFDASLKIGIKF